MTILAIDSASRACSACVYDTDTHTKTFDFGDAELNHSETLLPSVLKCLRSAGKTIDDVDRIGITVGPGSFTGVKIGVAEAKGIAFPRRIPCAPVSSLCALAQNAHGVNGLICALLDARRNQFYNALFRCENGKLTRLCDDRQIKSDELIRQINEPVFLIGDGAPLFAEACLQAGKPYTLCAKEQELIDARCVAQIAAETDTVSPEQLVPLYLRPSQAERIRLGIND